jgi:hypothetical protein
VAVYADIRVHASSMHIYERHPPTLDMSSQQTHFQEAKLEEKRLSFPLFKYVNMNQTNARTNITPNPNARCKPHPQKTPLKMP